MSHTPLATCHESKPQKFACTRAQQRQRTQAPRAGYGGTLGRRAREKGTGTGKIRTRLGIHMQGRSDFWWAKTRRERERATWASRRQPYWAKRARRDPIRSLSSTPPSRPPVEQHPAPSKAARILPSPACLQQPWAWTAPHLAPGSNRTPRAATNPGPLCVCSARISIRLFLTPLPRSFICLYEFISSPSIAFA
ncbi:hypothetical protein ANO11243_020660 [Dothideomycetidae sp. 11243]|nr:hypothetical protein ANO11243_020660 [fungal sp. No.11243]